MFISKTGLLIRALLLVMSFGFISWSDDASARAGGKRSFGQRSQPTTQPRSPNPPPSQHQQPPQQQPQPGRGSFMKGLAGGLAGGFLGSMLFSSLGHANGFGGGGGMGGIGFFDIILIAGLAFVAWRLWKSRQQNRLAYATATPTMASSTYATAAPATSPSTQGYFGQGAYGVTPSRLDRETAEDLFFRVQGAWTRQDLSLVRDYLDPEVSRVLDQDLQDLKARNAINRLENISVRNIDIGENWFEGEREYVRVRFTASLLDYTVDATTGAVQEGSSSEPVKFDENWVFAKSQGRSSWQLAGIEQI